MLETQKKIIRMTDITTCLSRKQPFNKFKIHPLGSKFLLSLLTFVMVKRNPITESFPVNFTQTFFVGECVPEVQLLKDQQIGISISTNSALYLPLWFLQMLYRRDSSRDKT
jgi:hypothetical protein